MNAIIRFCRLLPALIVLLAACSHSAELPISSGTGPQPVLPPPPKKLVPAVKLAPAKGWGQGGKPLAAEGMTVSAFADQLAHPRWIYILPNGDVLVAETNAPAESLSEGGMKAWIMKRMKKIVGASAPSADRITLLRDSNQDGVVDLRTVFLQNLHSPFGMGLVGDKFYVANTDSLMQYRYDHGQTRIDTPGRKVVDLPAGPINQHWTRNVIANHDGTKLYVTVGSNSNIGENGMDKEEGRAAIWEIDPRTGAHRIFASGLRNPIGLAWEPHSGALWTAVNERDLLGSDLVPDFMTLVRDGGFYGWPYSYFGPHVDERVKPQRPDLVASAIIPDYALGSHTASIGLAFSQDARLPDAFKNGMFVGQHGSWNRKPPSGYKVIFVPFEQGRPIGLPHDVLTGFLDDKGNALGRPVGVVIDGLGGLLVADDVGNTVWRVAKE